MARAGIWYRHKYQHSQKPMPPPTPSRIIPTIWPTTLPVPFLIKGNHSVALHGEGRYLVSPRIPAVGKAMAAYDHWTVTHLDVVKPYAILQWDQMMVIYSIISDDRNLTEQQIGDHEASKVYSALLMRGRTVIYGVVIIVNRNVERTNENDWIRMDHDHVFWNTRLRVDAI